MTLFQQARLAEIARNLGITPELLAGRALQVYEEAHDLVLADTGADGRQFFLVPAAAQGWRQLRDQAAQDGVTLVLASAYRSVERQAEIIRDRLRIGRSLSNILSSLAPPGCSEHHTGRAVDVAAPMAQGGNRMIDAHSPAYVWLEHRAADFGFRLSFPAGNPSGYRYEPWHWCWHCS